MTDNEIVQKYIRTPYKPDGRDAFTGMDCWTMSQAIYRDLGLSIIDIVNFAGVCAADKLEMVFEAYQEQFDEVGVPQRGDLVLMSIQGKLHAGIILGGRKMIQMTERGVVYSRASDRRWTNSIVGYYRPRALV